MTFLYILLAALGLLVLIVLVFASTAIGETIAWWTRRGQNRAMPDSPIVVPPRDPGRPVAEQYIIYLSGVGRNSGEEVPEKEAQFLDMVEQGLPGSVIVRDVFPYSPSSTPLTEHRLFGLWRAIPEIARRNRRFMTLYHIIYFRNLLQVCASRDSLYGPYYAYGFAKEMIKGLLRYGYRPEEPRPVTILCISGGGQLSQAAAPYMREWLGYKMRVISVGSVLADDAGTEDLEEIVHLSGSKDVTQFVGRVLGWSGWPIFPNSAWNRFVREGRYRVIPVGPMKHMGWGDYFSRSVKLADGATHVQRTAEVVIDLLAPPGARGERSPKPAGMPSLEADPVGAVAARVEA
ncbi:MAG: hypothetical protein MUC34_12650 [Anaerolineae bacterium]|jgi:hypothetical protein|nr:hypothetical protein [Anaerolineae bacterium]